MAKSNYQYDKADSLFKIAQMLDPDSEEIVIERLTVLHYKKNYNKIIKIAERSVDKGFKNSDIFIMLAESYSKLGETKTAISLLKKYLRNFDEKKQKIYFQLYKYNQKLGKKKKSRQYLEQAEEYSHDDIDFLYKISNAYVEMKDEAECCRILQKILNIDPDSYKANLWMGYYYFEQKDFENSTKFLTHIYNSRKILPPDFLKKLLISLYYSGNYQRVIDIADQVSLGSFDFFLKKIVFHSYFKCQEWKNAIKCAKKYILPYCEEKPDISDWTNELLGFCEFELKNYEQSYDYFSKIKNEKILISDLRTLSRLADLTHNTKLFDKLLDYSEPQNDTIAFIVKVVYAYYFAYNDSLKKAEKLLAETDFSLCKNDFTLKTLAYIILKTKNDVKKAEELLGRRKKPQQSTALWIGTYYSNEKKLEKSIPFLKKAIQQDSTSINAYFQLGNVYSELEDTENEIKILKAALHKFPEDAQLLNWLGYTFAEKGIKLDKAIKLLKKAVSIDAENVYIWDSLAWAFFQSGKYQQALEAMKLVLDQKFKDSVVNYHIGNIFWKLGEMEKAMQNWNKAIEINNNEEGVNKSKEMIKKFKQVNNSK